MDYTKIDYSALGKKYTPYPFCCGYSTETVAEFYKTNNTNRSKLIREFIKKHFAQTLTERGYVSRCGGVEWHKFNQDKTILLTIIFRKEDGDFNVFYGVEPMFAYLPYKSNSVDGMAICGMSAYGDNLVRIGAKGGEAYEDPLCNGPEVYYWKLDRIYGQLFYHALPFLEQITTYESLLRATKMYPRLNGYNNLEPNDIALMALLGDFEGVMDTKMVKDILERYKEALKDELQFPDDPLPSLVQWREFEKNKGELPPITKPNDLSNRRRMQLRAALANNDLSIFVKDLKRCEEFNHAYLRSICKKLYQ